MFVPLLGTVILALALSGCSSGPVEVAKPSDTPKPTPTATADPQGTRANPFPVGTAAQYDKGSVWTFTVGETDSDAWTEIVAANEFNQAPEAGNSYLTVPVHIALEENPQTAGGADAWASFSVAYVTASGNSFDSSTCSADLPDPGPLYNIGTMFGGAQADFLACAQVPSAEIPGGTWRIYTLIGSGSVFFVGAS